MRDDDLREALSSEASQARVPADQILGQIRRSGVRPGRPAFWERLRLGSKLEVALACVLLVALIGIGSLRLANQQRGGGLPVGPEVRLTLTSGDAQLTLKPGETATLPAQPITASLEFPVDIDPVSLRLGVKPAAWHLSDWGGPQGNRYAFRLEPDWEAHGPVTISIDAVKGADGKPLLKAPLLFHIETTPAPRPEGMSTEALVDLIRNAEQVAAEVAGLPESRRELNGPQRDVLAGRAAAAIAGQKTADGEDVIKPDRQYRLVFRSKGRTLELLWDNTQWFWVTWMEGGERKFAHFLERDGRLIQGIDAVLSSKPCEARSGTPATGSQVVMVYYSCNEEFYPMPRNLPLGQDALKGALEELLKGPTEQERLSGFYSWFSPQTAGMLKGVSLKDGKAVVDFANFSALMNGASTSAGSRDLVGQLSHTIFQFKEIREVEYRFDGNCEAFYGWLQSWCHPITADQYR